MNEDASPSQSDLALLGSLFDNSSDVVLVVDTTGLIRFHNARFAAEVGASASQGLGTPLVNWLHEASRAEVSAWLKRAHRTGEPGRFFARLSTPEPGDAKEFRINVTRRGTKVDALVLVGRDPAPSQRQERGSGRAIVDMFALSSELFAIAGPDGVFQRVSKSMVATLGYSEEELTRGPIWDLVHPDDRQATVDALGKLEEGSVATEFESRYRTATGEYRLLSWRVHRGPDNDLLFGAGRDVTRQEAVEQQLREAQKMDAVGQLAGGLAHDFNNLMLSVLVNAEFALEAAADDNELKVFLGEISEAGRRATGLVKQLLAFSRRGAVNKGPLDINALAQELCGLLERLLPSTIDLRLVTGAEMPDLDADRGQMEQVQMK